MANLFLRTQNPQRYRQIYSWLCKHPGISSEDWIPWADKQSIEFINHHAWLQTLFAWGDLNE